MPTSPSVGKFGLAWRVAIDHTSVDSDKEYPISFNRQHSDNVQSHDCMSSECSVGLLISPDGF